MTAASAGAGAAGGVLVLHGLVTRDGGIALWAETDRPNPPEQAVGQRAAALRAAIG